VIYGARVHEARDLRGLTQMQLAERLGVDPSWVAKVEADQIIEPRQEFIDGIADALGFPIDYFQDPDEIDFPIGSLLFRARGDMSKREEAQVRAWGSLLYRRVIRLSQRLRVPAVTLPRLADVTPADAAAFTRAALGLSPDGPIPHLINAVERAGVLVLALPIQLPKRDAFSAWVGEDVLRPVIVIVNGVPGDRLRFSIAHELGHLVMHQARPIRIKQIETEAGAFAEALLLPADGFAADVPRPITLTELARLKPKWRVAIQAMVMRIYHLGLITKWQYNYLFQQIGKRGWRLHEPDNLAVPVERPRGVRKMIEVLYGDPPDYLKIARDLRLLPHQARQLVESHADRSDLPPKGAVGEPRVVAFPRSVKE
jgi:Zn-dependent peptidase ImmA (M78 family)/transcriptional regulator with XRE-family HTH domain